MERSLAEDITSTAETFIKNFSIYGAFDFSIESLDLVEQLLDDAQDYVADDEDALFNICSMVGCYVFETARRSYGGEYLWDESSRQPILVAGLPDFSVAIMAWDKVKSRLLNGEEDNLPFYILGYKEHIENGKKKKGYRVTIV